VTFASAVLSVGDAQYSPTSAITVYYTQARQETANNNYLVPLMQAALKTALAKVTAHGRVDRQRGPSEVLHCRLVARVGRDATISSEPVLDYTQARQETANNNYLVPLMQAALKTALAKVTAQSVADLYVLPGYSRR
jgi:hypothetical protein